jgi:acetylornithine deacetylase/succinyl-diaminopimelate desuccinylase-like protein
MVWSSVRVRLINQNAYPAACGDVLAALPFSAPLILAVLLAPTLPLAAQTLSPYQQMGRDILRELVESDTTHATGDTTRAAEAMMRRFREAGFPEADLQLLGPSHRNQNLVVRFHGTGARPPVVMISHLDVVEAKREDWSFDPFRLTETNGYFYGRGCFDDKGGVATLCSALLRLRQEHFQPDRDLILALTAGEEAAADYNGVAWLLANHRDRVQGGICLNADAGGPEIHHGKRTVYALQAAEKVYLSYRLETRGPGGHSSLPTRDNPIYRLAAALERLEKHQFPVQLNTITRGYFEQMSQIETGQTAVDMKAVLQSPPDAEAARRLSVSPFYNALLRTTAVATMIEGGHAENALPQVARATVNCRILPAEPVPEVEDTLRRVIADDRITMTQIDPPELSPPSELTPEIQGAVRVAVNKLWPSLPIVPEMETGATDGLSFRNIGVPTYGITGIAMDPDDNRLHGKDERMEVRAFYDGLEFEYQLLKAISSARE